MDKYIQWANLTFYWGGETRDKSIINLEFPFESYRKGQRELAVAAYKTIVERKNLFVQAPTGIGKTMSTLFPAINPLERDIYLKYFT